MDREELAWAAGLFDGEGWVTKHSSRGHLQIGVAQSKSPAVLLRFQRAVDGLGHINGPYARPPHLDVWRFQTQRFEHVQAIVAMLWTFLSEPKKAQIVAAWAK